MTVAGTWWSSQSALDDSDTNLNIQKAKYIDNPLKLDMNCQLDI